MATGRSSPIILYLIMLLGFVLGFLYNSQLDPTAAVTPVPEQFSLQSLRGLDTAKIDFSIVSNPQFQALRVFGQLPVLPGTGGSENPFQ